MYSWEDWKDVTQIAILENGVIHQNSDDVTMVIEV